MLILQFDFINSRNDAYLFIYHKNGAIIFFLVYVDDLLVIGNDSKLVGNDSKLVSTFVVTLAATFPVKDLSALN